MTEFEILSMYEEEQLFLLYVDTLNTQISPLRNESNPSFGFFYKNNKLYFKDFTTGEFGDIFHFVSLYYKIPRYLTPYRIQQDINTGLTKNKYLEVKSSKLDIEVKITVFKKAWTSKGLDYWGKYNISKQTLELYDVFEIDSYYINNKRFKCKFSFCYWIQGLCKILNLEVDKKYKWYSNFNFKVLEGFHQIDFNKIDYLVITKALKECMFYHEIGIPAVSCKSESEIIKEEFLNYILNYISKDRIIVLLDNDEAGIKMTEKYKSLGFKTLLLNNYKNVTDWYEAEPNENTINEIKNLIHGSL